MSGMVTGVALAPDVSSDSVWMSGMVTGVALAPDVSSDSVWMSGMVTGVALALDVLFKQFFGTRVSRAEAIGPVCIRAWVDFR